MTTSNLATRFHRPWTTAEDAVRMTSCPRPTYRQSCSQGRRAACSKSVTGTGVKLESAAFELDSSASFRFERDETVLGWQNPPLPPSASWTVDPMKPHQPAKAQPDFRSTGRPEPSYAARQRRLSAIGRNIASPKCGFRVSSRNQKCSSISTSSSAMVQVRGNSPATCTEQRCSTRLGQRELGALSPPEWKSGRPQLSPQRASVTLANEAALCVKPMAPLTRNPPATRIDSAARSSEVRNSPWLATFTDPSYNLKLPDVHSVYRSGAAGAAEQPAKGLDLYTTTISGLQSAVTRSPGFQQQQQQQPCPWTPKADNPADIHAIPNQLIRPLVAQRNPKQPTVSAPSSLAPLPPQPNRSGTFCPVLEEAPRGGRAAASVPRDDDGAARVAPSKGRSGPNSDTPPPYWLERCDPRALKAFQRSQFFKTRLCPHFIAHSACKKGQSCNYAHSKAELRTSVNLTKTKLCHEYKTGTCTVDCCFAHGYHELRATSGFYKTQLCKFWVLGTCPAADFCRHAHGGDVVNPYCGDTRSRANRRSHDGLLIGSPSASSSTESTLEDESRSSPGANGWSVPTRNRLHSREEDSEAGVAQLEVAPGDAVRPDAMANWPESVTAPRADREDPREAVGSCANPQLVRTNKELGESGDESGMEVSLADRVQTYSNDSGAQSLASTILMVASDGRNTTGWFPAACSCTPKQDPGQSSLNNAAVRDQSAADGAVNPAVPEVEIPEQADRIQGGDEKAQCSEAERPPMADQSSSCWLAADRRHTVADPIIGDTALMFLLTMQEKAATTAARSGHLSHQCGQEIRCGRRSRHHQQFLDWDDSKSDSEVAPSTLTGTSQCNPLGGLSFAAARDVNHVDYAYTGYDDSAVCRLSAGVDDVGGVLDGPDDGHDESDGSSTSDFDTASLISTLPMDLPSLRAPPLPVDLSPPLTPERLSLELIYAATGQPQQTPDFLLDEDATDSKLHVLEAFPEQLRSCRRTIQRQQITKSMAPAFKRMHSFQERSIV